MSASSLYREIRLLRLTRGLWVTPEVYSIKNKFKSALFANGLYGDISITPLYTERQSQS